MEFLYGQSILQPILANNCNPYLVMLSVIIAVVSAFTTLKLLNRINASETKQQKFFWTLFTATIMGAGVWAMYLIGLLATPLSYNLPEMASTSLLAMMTSFVVLLSILLVAITSQMLKYKRQIAELSQHEEKLRVTATAFRAHEAIMITNADVHIIRVNDAFVLTTGFTEAEVLGKNPRVLSSGKHDTIFYKNIWNSIISTGKWSGEVWNRRKNGDIYPEWKTISVIRDQDGIITHYVACFSDITDFKTAKQQVEQLAFYDPLTNLPNRRLLYERLTYELNIAKHYQYIGALLFIDLDRFKNINDSLGHSVGDSLLKSVAERLQAILGENATAVRLGGDEFIVIVAAQNKTVNDLTDHTRIVAESIIAEITLPYLIVNHDLYISPSIGITLYTGDDDCVDLILKRGDTAMYHAKDAGRNTYCFYQQHMQEQADVRLTLEKNLRKAVEKCGFSVHYQPQSSLTGEIIGAEALIRWCHCEEGMISPTEFIPIAEETGLIIEIGSWIIETVCQQLNEWDSQNIVVPHIAINISPKQFHQADFVSMVIKIVETNHIAPSRILLEITEGVFLENTTEAVNKMNALRVRGFSFSMDDFGTGYSSLSYLKHLPFKQLKIDQSFVNDLINDANCAVIVQAIIVMAEALGLNLIAEGVETEQQLNRLSEYGCHFFQGYYFSKPLSSGLFTDYFLSRNAINQVSTHQNPFPPCH